MVITFYVTIAVHGTDYRLLPIILIFEKGSFKIPFEVENWKLSI